MVSFRKKKSSKAAGKAGADDVATSKGGAPPQADDSRDEQPAIPSRPPTMDDIPDLLATMEKEKGEKAANATKRVYELCDVGHKQNRVPMVCSGQYDVLTPPRELPHPIERRRTPPCLSRLEQPFHPYREQACYGPWTQQCCCYWWTLQGHRRGQAGILPLLHLFDESFLP